jgi:hypothetical protein
MEHAQHRQNLWCPDVIKEVLRTRLASYYKSIIILRVDHPILS